MPAVEFLAGLAERGRVLDLATGAARVGARSGTASLGLPAEPNHPPGLSRAVRHRAGPPAPRILSSRSAACSCSRRCCACRSRSCSSLGGIALGFVPGLPADHAAAGRRARRGAAAAALLGRLLHVAPRPAAERAPDRASSRSGSWRRRWRGRRRRARVDRPAVGGRVHARRVVSPTDALAATEIAARLGAPRRIVSIIEGESLVNDGTALVLYKAAVGAAVGGTFSLLDTSGASSLDVAGGIAIGLAVGWVVRQVRRRLDDPPIEVAIAVLCGLLRLSPGDAARRLRRARGRHDRRLHGLAHAGADDRAHAAHRRRVLGDPRLPGERAAVRARRPAAARASSTRSAEPRTLTLARLRAARIGDGHR